MTELHGTLACERGERSGRVDVLIGWPGGDWQATLKLAAALGIGYILLIWITTILWAYRDIRSRTRDPSSQMIGVAIAGTVPMLGIPLYLIARPRETLREAYDRQLEQEAILSELHSASACPSCRRPVNDDWMVCAHCSDELKEACRSCARPLSKAWRHCPYCATAKPQSVAARPPPNVGLEVDEPPDLDLHPADAIRGRRSPSTGAGGDVVTGS